MEWYDESVHEWLNEREMHEERPTLEEIEPNEPRHPLEGESEIPIDLDGLFPEPDDSDQDLPF